MANVDYPRGFRPLMRCVGGGDPAIESFQKDASEGTAIFMHDIVEQEADGNIAPGGTPGTTRYVGVALNYGAASTLTNHLVMISPDAVYAAQDNDASTGLVAADRGSNANAVFGAGSATTLISGHEINQSTLAGTNTLDLKLRDRLAVEDNAYGPHCVFECVINKHMLREGAGI